MKVISKIIFKFVARLVNLKKQVEEVQKMGVKVWAGVFNDPDDMIYYMNLGVDGIFTDNAKALLALIADKKNPQ